MISKLPIDVFLNNILCQLDAKSLVQLSLTSRSFAELCHDQALWKSLVIKDYYSSPNAIIPSCLDWKRFYSRLNNSRVYTWGENSDGRLGNPDLDNETLQLFNSRLFAPYHSNFARVSSPRQVKSLCGKNIIALVTGGWSFHALDKQGQVWMWGTLHKKIHHSMSIGTRPVYQPTLVELPTGTHITSISSGRSHVIALGADGSIWHWNNIWWPQRVLLPDSLDDSILLQVSANGSSSSVLTSKGVVINVPFPSLVYPHHPSSPPDLLLTDGPRTVFDNDLTQQSGLDTEMDHIVQIAGADSHTMALSHLGRVFRIDWLDSSCTLHEYIHFGPIPLPGCFISTSAHTFVVGTLNGPVWFGSHQLSFDQSPTTLSSLATMICNVSIGEYHFGALTNQGGLLTWGESEALGHDLQDDDPEIPRRVAAFQNEHVCAIAFGSRHSGALVIPKD